MQLKCCYREDLQLKMQVLERYAAIMQLKGRFLAVLVIAERIYIHIELSGGYTASLKD